MPLENLSAEEVACSAFRAFCYAGGVDEEPNWDGQSDEYQDRWGRVAIRSREGLASFDGKAVRLAAAWLAGLWLRDPDLETKFDSLPEQLQLCWQAVARHLATLLDSDDVEDVAALERSWADWAKQRRRG